MDSTTKSFGSIDKLDQKSIRWRDEIISLFSLLIFVFSLRTFVIEPYNVPTESLKPTILKGDYIIATKYSYGYSKYSLPFFLPLFEGRLFFSQPQRGDIVVFWPPKNVRQERWVKRLIGLPGEKIEIIDGVININDVPISKIATNRFIDEEGNRYNSFIENLPNNCSYKIIESQNIYNGKRLYNTGPYYIPLGHYFFMGDNRDESLDSRIDLGFVAEENLIAKGQIIHFSAAKLLLQLQGGFVHQFKQVGLWWNSIRWERMFSSLYKTPTQKDKELDLNQK